MGVLPASVRVAVWGSAALAGHLPVQEVRAKALPDIDEVSGLTERLELWRDFGERVLLVALPRPGDMTGMPGGPSDFIEAALDAQEAVYVAGLGGALVPRITSFGPEGDRGWSAEWTGYDTDPVPVHRLQALSLPDVELQLRRAVGTLTDQLAATRGGAALTDSAELELAARRQGSAGPWGLPGGLPARAIRVIQLARSIGSLAESGMDGRLQAIDSSTTLQRERLLQQLQGHAASALEAATNLACLHLAHTAHP